MTWYMNFCAPFIPNDPTINFHRYFQGALLLLYTIAYTFVHIYYKFWGPDSLVEEEEVAKGNPLVIQKVKKRRRRVSLSLLIAHSSSLRNLRRCRSR